MKIETDRLLLVPLSAADLRSMVRDKKLTANKLCWNSPSEELDPNMSSIYLLKAANIDKDQTHALFYTYWTIILKKSATLIGEIGLKGIPGNKGEVEVGYGLAAPEWYGNGYMTEALKAFIDWAFMQAGVRCVIAETEKTNLASQKVLQKAGMFFLKEEFDYFWWKIGKTDS